MIALVLAVLSADTLLIDVQLIGVDHAVVEAVLTRDSTLLLPARSVAAMLGLPAPASRWTTPVELRRQFPTITVTVDLRRLAVFIDDPLRVLPATRRAWERQRIQPRGTVSLPTRSGPFGSLSVDDSARTLLDGGYTWRARFALVGRVDDRGAAQWGVTLVPSAFLFLSYQDGDTQPPHVSARVAAGPIWISGSYTASAPSRADAATLVRLGDLQVFASRQFGVLTIAPSSQWAVQLAREWETGRTAARFAVGPAYASPFSFPVTSLGW